MALLTSIIIIIVYDISEQRKAYTGHFYL